MPTLHDAQPGKNERELGHECPSSACMNQRRHLSITSCMFSFHLSLFFGFFDVVVFVLSLVCVTTFPWLHPVMYCGPQHHFLLSLGFHVPLCSTCTILRGAIILLQFSKRCIQWPMNPSLKIPYFSKNGILQQLPLSEFFFRNGFIEKEYENFPLRRE